MDIFENKILNASLIIIGFWLASYVVTLLMGLMEKATSKTGTDLDDKIIRAAKLPVRYLAILLGFYYASSYHGFGWEWKGFGLDDAFLVLVVLLVCFTASRIAKTLFFWYGERDNVVAANQTMFIFTRKFISVIVYAIGVMIVFSQLGIQIGPLIAGLGIAGLAVALGLQSTLENLFSALFLVLDKSINVGDWIQLDDGTKAYIEDISWRSIRIRTIGGNTVIVPNSVFVGQKISSYDYPSKSFYTSIRVGVAYDSDLEKVEYVALQAAEKVIKDEEITVDENNPIVRYKVFADSSIELIVIVKIDDVGQEGKVQHSLIKEIHKHFKENNIEIPFPQRVVYTKKD